MAGLNLGVGGGIRIGGSPGRAAPATIAETAYGAGSSPGTPSGSGKMQTGHVATAVPVAAVAWLAFLRWSLPG